MTEVTATAATCDICFVQAVASPAANSLHELAALFPQFRADSGRSVQQAAESAEVSPPPSGRPHPFLRVVCPSSVSSTFRKLQAGDVTSFSWLSAILQARKMTYSTFCMLHLIDYNCGHFNRARHAPKSELGLMDA
jgi:hypothetical protein